MKTSDFRPVLVDYVRGRGVPAERVDACVDEALRTLGDLNPTAALSRPLMHAAVSEAIRRPPGWTSIDEDPPLLVVPARADDDFDRLWRLHLFRRALDELARESPELARKVEEQASADGVEARLRTLLQRAIHAYCPTSDQVLLEMQALTAAPGVGWMHDAVRRLLGPVVVAESASRPRGNLATVAVLIVLAGAIAWTTYSLRGERATREREQREQQNVQRLEVLLERSAAFPYEGSDAWRHQQELRSTIQEVRRLRPSSPSLARGLASQVGVAVDPALFKEVTAELGTKPEAAALAWEHYVYRFIRHAAWGEPLAGKAPSQGAWPRMEAELALLKGDDERALDLYLELQLVRPYDPSVWLGGALAAYKAGSPQVGARLARRGATLLDLAEPREGHAVALALEGLCLERLGREEERAAAFKAAAKKAAGNPHARALASRPAKEPAPLAPELPRGAAQVLLFEPLGEPAPAALDAALELIRTRLRSVAAGEVRWDGDARRLALTLKDPTAASLRAAEWLVVRRGVFTARDLAPRSLNDQWRHPSKPAGNEWAPINLYYPDLPKVAGRYRLLSQEIPLLAREDVDARFDLSEGRVVWSCKREAAMPAGAALALMLDGEIFWYGRVGDARSGFLAVGPADAQALIPLILGHGPLPVQFTRRN